MAEGNGKEVKKVVLASGAFDLVHYGHVRFLEEAKRAGGRNAYLVVVIARDSTIETLKGKKPVIPEDQRRAVVEYLKSVDEAILGYEEISLAATIRKIKPNIITVGYDQKDIEEDVKKIIDAEGMDIRIIRIGRFGPADLDSSSKIKRKIMNGFH